jgi:cardiolipin synthase (CMP-forming)
MSELSSTTAKEASRFNVPNTLCAIRLAGAFTVPVHLGLKRAMLAVIAVMVLTDWVDGKLARWLNQKTAFGARLDSVADISMYAAVLYCLWWLKWDFIRAELWWIAAAVGSYLVSSLWGIAWLGRWPNYHTRAAKISWLLMGIAIISVFAEWSAWPTRIALAAVTLTNLEAMAVTAVLPTWKTDVPSVFHAWRIRQKHEGNPAQNAA